MSDSYSVSLIRSWGEGERGRRVCGPRDQVGLDRLVEQVEQLLRRVVSEPAQHLEAEFGAEHRSQSQCPAALFADEVDTAADEVGDSGRDGEAEQLDLGEGVEPSLAGVQPDRLFQIQRVPGRIAVQPGHQPCFRAHLRGRFDEVGDLGLLKAHQSNLLGGGLTGDV